MILDLIDHVRTEAKSLVTAIMEAALAETPPERREQVARAVADAAAKWATDRS